QHVARVEDRVVRNLSVAAPQERQERITADARERATDFLLEEDDHRERQIEKDLPRDGFERGEIEGVGDEECGAEDHQADRDLHRARAADQREDGVDDDRDDENVDHVAPGELQREEAVEEIHRRRASIACSTLRKSTVSRTSCTRTIAAPPRCAAATPASDPLARVDPDARPVRWPMNPLRDAPITSGAIDVSSLQRARISRLWSNVFANPSP